MSDSNITKKALANALKELMEEKPFEKISVKDICEKCTMNRKSFYYHFKDKYDLVNWIFDTEFLSIAHKTPDPGIWDFLNDICPFFYENRDFYQKALCIKGQNSFPDHFRDLLFPIIANRIHAVFGKKEVLDFQLTFITDAVVMAFQRWIVDYDEMTPEDFIHQIKLSIKYITIQYGDMDETL